MLRFCLLAAAGFVGLEVLSYIVHRYVFHGLLWQIHQTHHRPDRRHGPFELNDLFSIGFAALSMALMWLGRVDPVGSIVFPLGLGVAVYGVLYFILHDLYTHRRFWPFKTRSRTAQTIRRAHQRHHQSIDKDGQEPYGLFLFPYRRYTNPFRRR